MKHLLNSSNTAVALSITGGNTALTVATAAEKLVYAKGKIWKKVMEK